MSDIPAPTKPIAPELRQKALQEELNGLVDVVGLAPLIDLLLERSFELGATDIHFDPRQDGLHIRLRLDGVLHDLLTLTATNAAHATSRVKLLAGMDITERRHPQDGQISIVNGAHRRDIRVGGGPTVYGERLVLRLMPDGRRYTDLDQLGFETEQVKQVLSAVNAPHGMVLSVGPVGCGKSTTTYACLKLLNDPGKSLVTIEDPVERRTDGVNQIQIDPKIGFGFPQALRGVLRQDPDVMMVGEIRDSETAHIAVRAGLTGIRVLSTMHASDTSAVIDVFREFQIPPMFIADSVNCIIAQRLLRRICEQNRETYHPDASTAQSLGVSPELAQSLELVRGVPSDANFHTGYFGRTGIFEVLTIDAEIREAILDQRSGSEISERAAHCGMSRLGESAIRKVLAGVTTVEEMHRVLMM